MAGKIAYNGILKDSTITMSSEDTTNGYNKENLFATSPSKKTRTTGISSQYILVDYGAAVNIKGLYFQGSNIVSGDTTCTIQAGTTSAATNWGPIALTKADKCFYELNQTYRYWKHIVTKASGSYVEWGMFDLFQNVDEFTKNYQYVRGTGSKKIFDRKTGPYGNISNTFLYRAQVRTWTFLNVTQAQADLFDETYGELEYCVIYDDFISEAFYGSIDISELTGQRTGNYDFILRFTEAK